MAANERELFLKLGELFEQGNLDDVKTKVQEELASNPNASSAFFWKGRLAEVQNQMDEAIEAFETAVRLSPKTALFYVVLAQAYEHRQTYNLIFGSDDSDPKAFEKIEACWKKAVELSPHNIGYISKYAEFLAENKKFEEALKIIQEARKENPGDESLRQSWLRVNLKIGASFALQEDADPASGLKHLEDVIREDDSNKEAHFFAGLCMKKLGNKEKARHHFEISLPENSDEASAPFVKAFYELAVTWKEMGNLKLSEETVRNGLKFYPEDAELTKLLSEINSEIVSAAARKTSKIRNKKDVSDLGKIDCEELFAPLRGNFQEITASSIADLPVELKKPFEELIRGISEKKPNEVKKVLNDLFKIDPLKLCKEKEQKTALGKLWLQILKEAYESAPGINFEIYLSCLPEFVRVSTSLSNLGELHQNAAFVLFLTGKFIHSFYSPVLNSEINLDAVLEKHCRRIQEFFYSQEFSDWYDFEDMAQFISKAVRAWLVHLKNFIKNRRLSPFLSILGLNLGLLVNEHSL